MENRPENWDECVCSAYEAGAGAMALAIGDWLEQHIISVKTDNTEHPTSKSFIKELKQGKFPT